LQPLARVVRAVEAATSASCHHVSSNAGATVQVQTEDDIDWNNLKNIHYD